MNLDEPIKYHLAFIKGFTVLEIVRGNYSVKVMRNLSNEPSNAFIGISAQDLIDNSEVDL